MEEGFKRVTKEIVIDSMCMHPAIGSLEDDDGGLEDIDDMPQCETELDFSVLVGHVGTIGKIWPDTQRIFHTAYFRIPSKRKRNMPIKPPRHLTTGKHGYRIRKWVK